MGAVKIVMLTVFVWNEVRDSHENGSNLQYLQARNKLIEITPTELLLLRQKNRSDLV